MKKLLLFGLIFELVLTAIPREGQYALYNETGKDLYIIFSDETYKPFPANGYSLPYQEGRTRSGIRIRIAQSPTEPAHTGGYDHSPAYPEYYFRIQNDTSLSMYLDFTKRASVSKEYYAQRNPQDLSLGINSATYVDKEDLGYYDVTLKVRNDTPPRRTFARRIAEFFGKK